MPKVLRPSELVLQGLAVESAVVEGSSTIITVRAVAAAGRCPACGSSTRRMHSCYLRTVLDLPLSGMLVRLEIIARRFRCDVALCSWRLFTERFLGQILRPWGRRTRRFDDLLHHLGLALGGRPGAGFSRRLVRGRTQPPAAAPTIVSIDDWAWRRNQRYGTLVCDLERHRVVALLPDREAATAEAWMSSQPQIAVVARDRSGNYALAVAQALPHAAQVADRWHLMENASRAFAEAMRQSMRAIRQVIGATTLNPALLTAAERIQYEGYLRREDTNAAVLEQARAGMTIKEIVRRTGHSRGLVRQILRGLRTDMFRARESSLEVCLTRLDAGLKTRGRGMGDAATPCRQDRARAAAAGSVHPQPWHAC